jgi:anti-sigma B factor antagonist
MLTDLKITDHPTDGDVQVVEVAGQIDLYSAPRFKERTLALIEAGKIRLIFDLSKVDYMDSTGLSVLVGARKRVRPQGGAIVVVTDSAELRRLFEMVGLDASFGLCSRREDALAAIAAKPAV